MSSKLFDYLLGWFVNFTAPFIGLPPFWAVDQLPSRDFALSSIGITYDYKKYLEKRLHYEIVEVARIHEAILDCERLVNYWQSVAEARSDFYSVPARYAALCDVYRQSIRCPVTGRLWLPYPVPLRWVRTLGD